MTGNIKYGGIGVKLMPLLHSLYEFHKTPKIYLFYSFYLSQIIATSQMYSLKYKEKYVRINKSL